jgi:hypothetical protein
MTVDRARFVGSKTATICSSWQPLTLPIETHRRPHWQMTRPQTLEAIDRYFA